STPRSSSCVREDRTSTSSSSTASSRTLKRADLLRWRPRISTLLSVRHECGDDPAFPTGGHMLTRRDMLIGAVAAGAVVSARPLSAKRSQPSTPVNFDVPAGACDSHTHIHGDPEKFPFFAGRVYTPETALPEEMAALHKALHIQRVVIVTPSVYGPDNSATAFGMKARGANARGVAVIDDKTSEADLDAMAQAGFRGIRLNLATGGVNDPNVGKTRFSAAVDR